MDILWYGLKVAVVGMLVVFAGLIILIGCIKALKVVRSKDEPEKSGGSAPITPPAQPVVTPPAVYAPRTYTPGPMLTKQDDAFYAVVTAAIAETLASEGIDPNSGFAIRAVKTIHERLPGPPLTLNDDALYAVITGVVSEVLASEGKNPEGGFAIRSVKAL